MRAPVSALEERLRELAAPLEGDWADVVSRGRQLTSARSRRLRRRLVLAFAMLTLVLTAGSGLAIGNRLFGWFEVSESPKHVPTLGADVPYITGDRVHVPGRKEQRLALPLLAPLLGTDAPLAVRSPDGRYVAYHSWERQTPLLLVHDLDAATGTSPRSGRDDVLARGAQTVAWSRGGRIAYFQATQQRYREGAYLGHVVVRESLERAAVRWTRRPGGYEVLAWARDRLVVSVRGCVFPACANDPEPGVYVIDRRGRLLPLGLERLSALSPDGRYAIGPYTPNPGSDNPIATVRVVDIERRRPTSTLDLQASAQAAGFDRRPFLTGLHRATWRGNEIVGASSGVRLSALAVLRATNGRLEFGDAVQIAATTVPAASGTYFGTPSFAGGGTRRVIVPVTGGNDDNRSFAAVLTCDRETRKCVRGKLLDARRWFAVLANPSRPR